VFESRILHRLMAAAAAVAVLAGCSSSKSPTTTHSKGYFSTQGLRAPEGLCEIKPSRIGLAEKIRNINEGNGCEVPDAWSVQQLGSVAFSQSATLNCGMAAPLKDWLEDVVQPTAQKTFGESVVSVDVAASYSCRPRNNKYGAKMSEHGYGNAIDIAAFTLESGRRVTVLDGWRGQGDERKFLHTVHDEACGEFRTVLGPDANAAHRNHFHLDLQNRASGGVYCR
jgi:hypothetical protein